MERREQQRSRLLGPMAIWGMFGLSVAHAGEPLAKMASELVHGTGPVRAVASPLRLPAARLDLTPPTLAARTLTPTTLTATTLTANLATELSGGAVPRRGMGVDSPRQNAAASPGILRTEQWVMSKPEELMRNFRREGLPLARLWQTDNSLVHFGLNQKGKPGLWIIEKLH